ncbi:MAG: rRNA methyltransferase [Bacteroidetes bacterium]|nr:MAG: rRNA methyltransferase [Bacteroidota bacterium]
MFPEGFIQRIYDQKYIDAEALLRSLEEPSPVSIRINSSKWNKTPLISDPVPWCRNGYYLGLRPSFTLDPLFHSGCYYPQEASGMFIEQAVLKAAGSLKNIRVLDLCGAPGGKSTHLSDIIGADNLLVANEVIRSRAVILVETITKWGCSNTLVTQNDPAAFGRLSGYFDIILVDAPCSGEGMFRTNVAINEWSVENTMHCSERQKRIIMDIWPALKENGILTYSTCTFNPDENEENIKWLLGKNEAECVSLNIEEFKGVTEIDYQGIYGYGFYPDRIRGEGYFISVIRKKGNQEKTLAKSRLKKDVKPVKDDLAVAGNWTDFPRDRLVKWDHEILAVPCGIDEYLYLFQNLKIVKAGTKIFNVKKQDYLPSHELSLSQKLKKDAFPCIEIDLTTALSFLRRDNFKLHNAIKGWSIVSYQGINLGFVKNLGNRLNNYFPVEWRIRMNVTKPGDENIIVWEKEGTSLQIDQNI